MNIRMNNLLYNVIHEQIKDIINNASRNIELIKKKQKEKLHFIPISYRVFGGILQSMNIKFGYFIEEFIRQLISNESDLEIINKYSGKKNNIFFLSHKNDRIIDAYITHCKHKHGYCNTKFLDLMNQIIDYTRVGIIGSTCIHDIDLLFRQVSTNRLYYIEIKYNDDHDTGKFVDINRKFIKTYAYLVRELDITNIYQLTPILFFFNDKKMKHNPYIPEAENIMRGQDFFDEFIKSISYKELNEYMQNLSESPEIKKMFDDLYNKIVNSPQLCLIYDI